MRRQVSWLVTILLAGCLGRTDLGATDQAGRGEEGAACTSNDACLGVCVLGRCASASPAGGPCDEADDCLPGHACIGARCEPVAAVCGNGTEEVGEACDDGNTATEACAYGETACTVCAANCTEQAGVTSYCGDGFVDADNAETCDDGDTVADDGCTPSCTIRTGWVCDTQEPSRCTSSYVAAVLADIPLLYWRLGEAGGNVASDASGNSRDGLYASCTLGVTGALVYDNDTAVAFDGVASTVSGPVPTFAVRAPFTVEAWVRPATATNFGHLLNHEPPNGVREGFALFYNFGTPAFERFVSNSNLTAAASGPIPTIVFSHLVGTYDGNTLSLYVNGVLADAVSDTRVSVGYAGDFVVGACEDDEFFEGTIDEVAVYDYALSPERVLAHFVASGR